MATRRICPAVYSVYGDLDASDNLGDVNPTLFASGTCSGPTEQLSGLDAGVDGGPQVQLGTNFVGTDLLFDVSVTVSSSFALDSVSCTFTKN